MPVPPNLANKTDSSDTKPRIWWALLLPLTLGLGVLWQQTRPTEVVKPTTQSNISPNSSTRKPPLARQFVTPVSILVPGDDGQLHRKKWSSGANSHGNETDLSALYTRWINAIIVAAPDMYPAGAKVKKVTLKSDAEPAQIDFNAAFAKPDFWNGETKTKLAVYALVNTLSPIMLPKGRAVPVQFLVEGKEVSTLGEFDVSEPIEADLTLNAEADTRQQSTNSAPQSAQKSEIQGAPRL